MAPVVGLSPEAWKDEGNSKLTAGDDTGALECYTRGIEAAQEATQKKLLSVLHCNRAQAFLRIGSLAQALNDCEIALEQDPTNGKAYWRGASTALKLERPMQAVTLCRKGLEVLGDSDSLNALLEEAHAQLKSSTDVLEETPDEERSERPAGPGVLEGGNTVTARDLALRGASLLERYQGAFEAVRDEDDVLRARRLFEGCLKEDPDNETALLGLGDILDNGLGVAPDKHGAAKLWHRAQQLGSDAARVKLSLQAIDTWAVMARKAALEGR